MTTGINLNMIDFVLLIIIIIMLIKIGYEYVNIFTSNIKKTHYLFMTGGYDSTFRLCYLVLVENKYVQPIYINIPGMDGDDIPRENQSLELYTIQSVITQLNYILNTDKTTSHKIFPLITINNHTLSNEVHTSSYNLYKQKKLNKPISQYTYMCSIAIKMNKDIETGVLVSKGGPIYKSVGNIIIFDKIKLTLADKNQLMFRNLLFPLAGMTKYQLKKISIKNGFFYILKQTISCWFPDDSGIPCGNCPMCKERII
jgi:hypothetical protein